MAGTSRELAEGADMYIEETGAGDGDIKVTVEGAEYTAEANYDMDGDGVDDTVTVMTEDGHVAYVDENADGAADVMHTADARGTVVSQARFDAESGNWVSEQPQQHPGADPQQQAGRSMLIDTPKGDQQIGPATEDTDNDGRADTAVVPTDRGTMLVTDVDGDGSADQLVEIGTTGEVTITHHTGRGEWSLIEQGRLDHNGQYTPNPQPVTGATDDATWTLGDPEPAPQPARPSQQEQRPQAARPDSDASWR